MNYRQAPEDEEFQEVRNCDSPLLEGAGPLSLFGHKGDNCPLSFPAAATTPGDQDGRSGNQEFSRPRTRLRTVWNRTSNVTMMAVTIAGRIGFLPCFRLFYDADFPGGTMRNENEEVYNRLPPVDATILIRSGQRSTRK
ncbi:hypothetical protein [Geminicoccus roseus]|uniref:hypothetical protein n=1 Tax=Geminicoccus roseus TaxID=404900 RepID=UPI0012FB43D6|nr:hypothetical protein [Geminicoccus roseus]